MNQLLLRDGGGAGFPPRKSPPGARWALTMVLEQSKEGASQGSGGWSRGVGPERELPVRSLPSLGQGVWNLT